jgi:hypothetical protein
MRNDGGDTYKIASQPGTKAGITQRKRGSGHDVTPRLEGRDIHR